MTLKSFGVRRFAAIGWVMVAALAAASTGEKKTFAYKFKEGAEADYSIGAVIKKESKDLGKLHVKVLKVEKDGTADLEMKSGDDKFVFSMSDHGELTKDPGGKQGIVGVMSIAWGLPKGEIEVDADATEFDGAPYGSKGKATVKCDFDKDDKELQILAIIESGGKKYAFLNSPADDGGLPKTLVVLAPTEDDAVLFRFKKD